MLDFSRWQICSGVVCKMALYNYTASLQLLASPSWLLRQLIACLLLPPPPPPMMMMLLLLLLLLLMMMMMLLLLTMEDAPPVSTAL